MLRKRQAQISDMFATKSHSWEQAGLTRQITQRAARRAKRQMIVLTPLIAGVLVVYFYRDDLFGAEWDREVRIATVVALVVLGWSFARDVGAALGPALFRRMDPSTAGTVGFLIRLGTLGIVVLVALRIAGLDLRALAVGASFTAVIFGLAAQQTLGNLIAGMVLLSARPFRVGDRIKLEGSGIVAEGIVSSLGLMFTTMASGDDTIMVPNSVVLNQAIIPLREPDAVDMRARLRPGLKPSDVQRLLNQSISIATRSAPQIVLEEIRGDEVVVRIRATPQLASEGPQLADEILTVLGELTAVNGDDDPVATADRPSADKDFF